MLGYEVNKGILDARCAEAVLDLRAAFDKIESIAIWLANNPTDGTTDPLVATYGYTSDEAYALRLYFETFNNVRTSNSSTLDIGRHMTGLE